MAGSFQNNAIRNLACGPQKKAAPDATLPYVGHRTRKRKKPLNRNVDFVYIYTGYIYILPVYKNILLNHENNAQIYSSNFF